eukprot:765232-Hanusia_phi.AAC.8
MKAGRLDCSGKVIRGGTWEYEKNSNLRIKTTFQVQYFKPAFGPRLDCMIFIGDDHLEVSLAAIHPEQCCAKCNESYCGSIARLSIPSSEQRQQEHNWNNWEKFAKLRILAFSFNADSKYTFTENSLLLHSIRKKAESSNAQVLVIAIQSIAMSAFDRQKIFSWKGWDLHFSSATLERNYDDFCQHVIILRRSAMSHGDLDFQVQVLGGAIGARCFAKGMQYESRGIAGVVLRIQRKAHGEDVMGADQNVEDSIRYLLVLAAHLPPSNQKGPSMALRCLNEGFTMVRSMMRMRMRMMMTTTIELTTMMTMMFMVMITINMTTMTILDGMVWLRFLIAEASMMLCRRDFAIERISHQLLERATAIVTKDVLDLFVNMEMQGMQKANKKSSQNTMMSRFHHFFDVFSAKIDDFRSRKQLRARCLAGQEIGNQTRCHEFVGKKHDMISGYLLLGDFNAYSHCKEAREDGSCAVWSDVLQESIVDGRLNFSKAFGWAEAGAVQEGVADVGSAFSRGPEFPPTCHARRGRDVKCIEEYMTASSALGLPGCPHGKKVREALLLLLLLLLSSACSSTAREQNSDTDGRLLTDRTRSPWDMKTQGRTIDATAR